MDKLTITEALAELKTIGKRLDKKQEFIVQHVFRQEQFKDPLEKDGGSVAAIKRELQATEDLAQRVVTIRAAIAKANAENAIMVNGDGRTIADWLVWRREIAPRIQRMQGAIRGRLDGARNEANKRGYQVVQAGAGVNPMDVVVNVNETELADEIEGLETTLGTLDGLLSLKNATVVIEV